MKMKSLMVPILAAFPLLPALALADVTLVETKAAAGIVQITAENEYLKLVVTPDYGGMVTGFTNKKTGNQWIMSPSQYLHLTGLFGDHIQLPTGVWPGECMTAKYGCQIVRSGPDEAVIKLEYRLNADGPAETTAGLKLEKEIILKKAVPAVGCKITVINDTDKPKIFTYWLQNAYVKLGSTKDRNYYYRPSARGIRVTFWELAWPAKNIKGEAFVEDPAAGWSGAVNPKDKEGFVSLMDFACLKSLYNSTGDNSVEWFCKEKVLQPGEQWSTEVLCRPTSGFDAYSYASRNFIADTKVAVTGESVQVIQDLAATETAVTDDVDCQVTLLSFPERKELAVQKVKFSGAALEPASRTLTFQGVVFDGLLAIRVALAGKNGTETYETYYDPSNKDKAFFSATDYRLRE